MRNEMMDYEELLTPLNKDLLGNMLNVRYYLGPHFFEWGTNFLRRRASPLHPHPICIASRICNVVWGLCFPAWLLFNCWFLNLHRFLTFYCTKPYNNAKFNFLSILIYRCVLYRKTFLTEKEFWLKIDFSIDLGLFWFDF